MAGGRGRLGTDSSRNKGPLGTTSLWCWGTPVGHGGQGDRVGPEAKQGRREDHRAMGAVDSC